MADVILEPPEGSRVLIGAEPYQLLLIRDSRGLEPDDAYRWWLAHDEDGGPYRWEQIAGPNATFQQDDPMVRVERTHVVELFTREELDRAVRDGGYEDIGQHRIALGSGICVRHGEHYELPHELDRLRDREGGGRG